MVLILSRDISMSKQILEMFSAAIYILLVTACATQAQKQTQNLVNQVNYAKTEAEKCISQVVDSQQNMATFFPVCWIFKQKVCLNKQDFRSVFRWLLHL